jgi:bifunctional ADP-heptose synthase (sugar kinase/adenylyltransferase)
MGVGRITPIGFCGEDGEGFELRRALGERRGVELNCFHTTALRNTFTYGKPLVMREGHEPQELDRLDIKNWTATPPKLEDGLVGSLESVFDGLDALIVLDQVDVAETGVVTRRVLEAIDRSSRCDAGKLVLADSRRGLADFPPLAYKMNASELAAMESIPADGALDEIRRACGTIAGRTGSYAFVTLAERGIVGSSPGGPAEHAPSRPPRGAIDIVGAGDAVTANLAAVLAAGGKLREALTVAMAAASIVVHQTGTTGTADCRQIAELLSTPLPSAGY